MIENIFYDMKSGSGLTMSLCSQVARELGRNIVNGVYIPGNLVEDEGALSERFQVSRTVVRDAVKILVGKGLLEVRRGIGTRVKPRADWGLLDDDVMAWQLSEPPRADTLLQLLEVRQVFEPQAAYWAADRATQEDLGEIDAACIAMQEAIGDPKAFVLADARFHRATIRAAHNEFLLALEGVIYSALLSSIRLTNPDAEANAKSVPLHRAVYEAIVQSEGDEAAQKMRLLLGDASARIKQLFPAS